MLGWAVHTWLGFGGLLSASLPCRVAAVALTAWFGFPVRWACTAAVVVAGLQRTCSCYGGHGGGAVRWPNRYAPCVLPSP